MTRSPACLAWVLACALAACFRSHPADRVELMGTDCAMCHLRDYQATTAPVHPATPQVFTTACARCHRTLGWQPALEGLHRDTFVIATGPHAPVACLDCHQLDRGASKAGANTAYRGLDVVALRDIPAGEELTLDYADYCNDSAAAFDCRCGAPNCRGWINVK